MYAPVGARIDGDGMPVHNEDVAAIFDEFADLLEIDDANPFRVRAYRNAARTVRSLGRDLSEMVAAGEDLTALPGIGTDLAAKVVEIIQTGTAKALRELHRRLPTSLEALLEIPGLGPKRVKALYRELGIKNLDQLEAAARAGRLEAVAGFGMKTQRHILEAIAARRTTERRFLLSTARDYAEPLANWLRSTSGVTDVLIAGSYRRGRETVGDLDILVAARDPEAAMNRLAEYDEVAQVVARGGTRATVILDCGIQVDVRVVARESLGAALHYFTGSKAHNIAVRRLGQQRGLKINEYGVYKGQRRVAGRTETSVFRAVGLPYIPPTLREDRGEIDAARSGRLPLLIERGDLKGDLHSHTAETDGRADLRTMALAAQAAGLKYLAITDHSRHLTVAHGLDQRRLRKQHELLSRLNEELSGITLLHGIEVDILEDGSLDLPGSALAELDLVVAAVHGQFNLSRTRQTERIMRAMDNPYFSILAHPSGRLLNGREPYDIDMPRIIRHARERGCFLELNAQPERLDLNDTFCRMARDENVLVVVSSDAHTPGDFAKLDYGIVQAQRGWLEKSDVLNTRPLAQLRKLLRKTMGS